MDAHLKQLVRDRAGNRCEYCGISAQQYRIAPLQIEHIIARQHGGPSHEDNLALACIRCNLCKGPNISGIDPTDGSLTALFHPRRDRWSEHFQMDGARIIGLTPIGRATVLVLNMNAPNRIRLRQSLADEEKD